MTGEPLSGIDSAWLRMEDPTNLMMITGVMVLGAPVSRDRLRATLAARLLLFDRFRQRVVASRRPGGRLYWQWDPCFDLDYHVQPASLPVSWTTSLPSDTVLRDRCGTGAPGDEAALRELAGLLAGTPLDPARPLWQIHLVEGYGRGAALVCRFHHCIGDGLALVHVLLSLATAGPEPGWPAAPRPPDALHRAPPALRGAWTAADDLAAHWRDRLEQATEQGGRGVDALSRLLLLPAEPATCLKGPLGQAKRVAWSAAWSLDEIKGARQALGCTVNDLLLAAVAGALRRYLRARGPGLEVPPLRAIVPVNLRAPGTETALGNRFGLLFASLPVDVDDARQRLRAVKQEMDAHKRSLEAPSVFVMLGALGLAPLPMQDLVVNLLGSKATAVVTNVAGPPRRLCLAGAPLEAMMFWVPQSGRLGLGVSLLSYGGCVWLGVMSDGALIPDPESLVVALEAELDGLRWLAAGEGRAVRPGSRPAPGWQAREAGI